MQLIQKILETEHLNIRPAPFENINIGSENFWSRIDGLHGDQHIFKATLAVLEMESMGYINSDDFDFLFSKKFPFLFSKVSDEFSKEMVNLVSGFYSFAKCLILYSTTYK